MYGHLIQWLNTLANGRLIIFEQGVHDNSIYRKECLLQCSKGLFGKPISKLCVKNLFSLEIKDILHCNTQNYINNWKSLQF